MLKDVLNPPQAPTRFSPETKFALTREDFIVYSELQFTDSIRQLIKKGRPVKIDPDYFDPHNIGDLLPTQTEIAINPAAFFQVLNSEPPIRQARIEEECTKFVRRIGSGIRVAQGSPTDYVHFDLEYRKKTGENKSLYAPYEVITSTYTGDGPHLADLYQDREGRITVCTSHNENQGCNSLGGSRVYTVVPIFVPDWGQLPLSI